MHWIAPSEKDTDNAALEKRLCDAADQFRANSGLKSQEYSAPVLGLIFLRFARVCSEERSGESLVQPPRALLDRSTASVGPGFRLIYKPHLQIQNLRRTRELLLPRLLSGQVEPKTEAA
jgi:hypothetical protein